MAVVVLCGLVLLVLRRPDAFGHPPLWAEDGVVFMRDAFVRGIPESIVTPYAGYLLLVPRLWAAATSALPVAWLPLSYALFGYVMCVASCGVVLSSRLSTVVPNVAVRAGAFFLLLIVPSSPELYGNLTNIQWYFGIALFLLAISEDPRGRAKRLWEALAVATMALTGLMAVVFAPLFGLRWLRTRSHHSGVLLGVVMAGGGLQLAVLARDFGPGSRVDAVGLSHLNVGAVTSVLVVRVGGAAALGQRRLEALWAHPSLHPLLMVLGVLALVAVGWQLCTQSGRVRLALVVALCVSYGATVASHGGNPAILLNPLLGPRYFALPLAVLVVVWAIAVCAIPRGRPVRAVAVALPVILIGVGAISDFRLTQLPDIGWDTSAHCIAQHRPCHVRLAPEGWSVDLPAVPTAR
jgi:hypothetical protein